MAEKIVSIKEAFGEGLNRIHEGARRSVEAGLNRLEKSLPPEEAEKWRANTKKNLETANKVGIGSLLAISAAIIAGVIWGSFKTIEYGIDKILEAGKGPKINVEAFLDKALSKITGDKSK